MSASKRRSVRIICAAYIINKTADLVRQEFYGWVLAHYAVRWLMHQAATGHCRPDRSLSFTANVQLLRRAQPQSGAFPPGAS